MSSYCSECGKEATTCGEHILAPCVKVEQEFPEISSLHEKDNKGRVQMVCTDMDTVISDVYEKLQTNNDVIKEIDESTEEKITQFEEALDELSNLCNILNSDISSCGLDLSAIAQEDGCNNSIPINTLKDLLQRLINLNA